MTRRPEKTLVEIFAIDNRWVRLAEICNHLMAKIDRRGAGCLTQVERTIDRVNDFEYRMIRGGLRGLLHTDWMDWQAIRDVSVALDVAGARDAARLLRQMLAVVATALDRQPALRTRDDLAWDQLLALIDPGRDLERIEEELAAHVDGLHEHLAAYVESHEVDLFRADEGGASGSGSGSGSG
jgi:hypothetical protein